MNPPSGVPYRDEQGELVWHGFPTWAQEMAALAEAVGRYRRNNPRPRNAESSSEEERAALRAEIWRGILDDLYPPGGVEHEGEYRRLIHADLAEMSDAVLTDEAARARLRGYLDQSVNPWLDERLQALNQEQARRKALLMRNG